MNLAIQLKNFSFKYTNVDILKNLNLNIGKGECVGLLGSNGSGKTTLIKCLIGMLKGRGRIKVFDYTPNIYSIDFKKNIGIVLDHDLLLDYLTLEEYLHFVGNTYDIKGKILEEKIDHWVKFFDLEHSKNKIIKYFSHGMRKKTQIIAGILHEPELFIIDEPTNALDVEMIYQLKILIKKLHQKGTTILTSTHHLPFVEEVCERVIIINNGNFLEDFLLSSLKESNLEEIFIKSIRGEVNK
jgi:ABC-2 type transport system ATP-binding protein